MTKLNVHCLNSLCYPHWENRRGMEARIIQSSGMFWSYFYYLFENMLPYFLFSLSNSSIIWCSTSMRLIHSCSPLSPISISLILLLWKCLPLDFLILLLEISFLQSHFFISLHYLCCLLFAFFSLPLLFSSVERPSSAHLVFHSHLEGAKAGHKLSAHRSRLRPGILHTKATGQDSTVLWGCSHC